VKRITSLKNNLIKDIKKLSQKKYRDQRGEYLIEGDHLVEEAVNAGAPIVHVLFTEKALTAFPLLLEKIPESCRLLVTEDILRSLSSHPDTPDILAVVAKTSPSRVIDYSRPLLLLDGVQDPGNVGTMIRTADAAGFGTVVLGEGSADIYNDKVLRAMQGSQFHIAVYQGSISEWIGTCKAHGLNVYGTELNPQAVDYRQVPKTPAFALVMGNEGQGLSAETLSSTTQNLYIPITGQAESLNVAVAAGILMFALKN